MAHIELRQVAAHKHMAAGIAATELLAVYVGKQRTPGANVHLRANRWLDYLLAFTTGPTCRLVTRTTSPPCFGRILDRVERPSF